MATASAQDLDPRAAPRVGRRLALVSSFGSEGDVRPFLALGAALRRAGYAPFLVAESRFRARAEALGLGFRPSGQRWDEAQNRAAMTEVLRHRSPLAQARSLIAHAERELVTVAPTVVAATADADAIVYHGGDVTALAAALAHGKPRVTGCLATNFLPGGLGPWLARRLAGRFTDGNFNRVLAAAGVAPRRGVILETSESPLLNLVAVSLHVVPPPAAWRGRYWATGYWFLDEATFEPDPALRDFIERGEAPLVVTFGSMTGLEARVGALAAAILEGLRRSGRRAVLQAPPALLGGAAVPGWLHVTQYVPHDWLFPRAAAVLHHGGAGTSAAAARAGVPQIVAWVFGDQPEWGRLMHRRGVAPPPVALRDLDAAGLARRIAAIDEPLRARARALGERIAAEDGVGRAVALLAERLPAA